MADKRILIAEDEERLRRLLGMLLSDGGYKIMLAADGQEARDCIDRQDFDLLITDLKMPRKDGATLLREVREERPELPVIVITAFGSIESAVEMLQAGAIDYITKPFEEEKLKLAVERGLRFQKIMAENRALRREASSRWGLDNIVTVSPGMQAAIRMARQVAASNANVIVYGESGSGKELITRGIHVASQRAGGPFVAINCAAIPDALLESELFGHERGAFTGAVAAKPGKFELAEGGTLFLDEIGDLSQQVQAKVLRAIENREIQRVGSNDLKRVDVRFIAATNKTLETEVRAGRFREDLFFRLNVFPIHLPPLRERSEDIVPLTRLFLEQFCSQMGRRVPEVPPATRAALEGHEWPGNVRELQNAIERAVILLQGDALEPDFIVQTAGRSLKSIAPGGDGDPYAIRLPGAGFSLDEMEKRLLAQALKRSHGKKTAAARMLGLSRATFRYRLEKFGLHDNAKASSEDDAS